MKSRCGCPWIPLLRRERATTQERFEEFTGHTRQYLWGLEQGKRNPTVVALFELAQTLSRSPIDLITPEGKSGQLQMRRAPRARK